MVNRQNLVSIDHLVDYGAYLKTVPDRFLKTLEKATEDDHIESLTRNILKRRINYLNCSYTSGVEIDQSKSIGEIVLEDTLRYTELDDRKSGILAPDNILEQYIECTWILSFAYFFNADKTVIEKIIQHIPYTGKDKLIDRLIAAIIPDHPVSQEIAFPDVYKPICDAMAVYDKDARDVLVQLFLKKYYPSLKKHDVTWYDSHKEKDPEYNFHTGYWVFELAAVAVACGWDDSDFRDNMYYPKDLADWKREQLK
jgi:hypothetical protein